jgi:hypothetical protein
MTSTWTEVRHYLNGTRDALRQSTAKFPDIDVSQLAADLRLVEKAKDARATDSLGIALDAVEREIVDDIRRRAREAHGEYNAALNLYEARLSEVAVGEDAFVFIKNAAVEGLGNFRAQSEEDRLPLAAVERRAAQMAREFDAFVARHRREDTAPIVLSTGDKVWSVGWIALLLVFETLLNGLFFAQESDQGLLGGVTQAFMLSVVNVAIAGALGLIAVRYAHHVGVFQRMLAWLSIAVLVGAGLLLNLVIAHYRDAFETARGATVDFASVWAAVVATPWAINDLMSWVLALGGVITCAVAAWKFYGLDDPYPGYGRVARRFENSQEHLADDRRACIDTLTQHRDATTDEMKNVLTTVSINKREFEMALKQRERLRQDFKHHVERLAGIAAHLGTIYRSARPFPLPLGASELSANLETPQEMLTDFPPHAAGMHQHAIDTMSDYIDRIAEAYAEALAKMSDTQQAKTLYADADSQA